MSIGPFGPHPIQPESFGLYLVLTRPTAGYQGCTEAAVEHAVRYVQLRMKDQPFEDVLRIARRLKAIVRGTSTRLIINDDLSVARACDADGLHLGQDDLTISQARRHWSQPGKLYGLSTHDERQASEGCRIAPDYLGVGPVFATPTKAKPDPVLGVPRASAIVRASPLTCVAIGGIDENTLPEILVSGITNFAVVRAVCQSPSPGSEIEKLMRIWRAHQSSARACMPDSSGRLVSLSSRDGTVAHLTRLVPSSRKDY